MVRYRKRRGWKPATGSEKFSERYEARGRLRSLQGLILWSLHLFRYKDLQRQQTREFWHYEQDAKTLASWGVDMVKMDHCGHKNGTDPQLYGKMSKALNATGRQVLFSPCNWGEDNVWSWGSELAQMYRIQMDHLPFWKFGSNTSSDGVGYGQGTFDIIEWMAHLVPSKWVKQYGYMDPDFLMTEYFTMDFVASRTEYTFWSLWSSPLLVSTDLRKISKENGDFVER